MKSTIQTFFVAACGSFLATTYASPAPMQMELTVHTKDDPWANKICLMVCWPEPPICPTDWYSYNQGTGETPCYTCCRSSGVSAGKAKNVKQINASPEAPTQTLAVPEVDVSISINANQVKDQTLNNQGICFKVCWPTIPTCPDGWYSNNFGTANSPCWTCCKSPSDLFAKGLPQSELKV